MPTCFGQNVEILFFFLMFLLRLFGIHTGNVVGLYLESHSQMFILLHSLVLAFLRFCLIYISFIFQFPKLYLCFSRLFRCSHLFQGLGLLPWLEKLTFVLLACSFIGGYFVLQPINFSFQFQLLISIWNQILLTFTLIVFELLLQLLHEILVYNIQIILTSLAKTW